MRPLKKAIAGLLLLVGVPILALAALEIVNPQSSQQDRSEATAALILLGIPPTVAGAWLIGSLRTDARRQERDRLRSSFFALVKQGRGKVSVFDFAEATGLSGDRARLYLDERARTFNATFHVGDEGSLFYVFTLGYTDTQRLLDDPALSEAASPPPLESESNPHGAVTYDILLRGAAIDRQAELLETLQTLTHHSLATVQRLVDTPLSLIVSGVERSTAEHYRQRLEAAGAQILVVLPPPTPNQTDDSLHERPKSADQAN